MYKINLYIFNLTSKYILINILLVTILVLFINLLEISRILESNNFNIYSFILLSILKVPSVISETISFAVIIAIAFLFRNLISNNELISMRNIGFSILDIFKPIATSIFLFGILILIIINPLAAKLELEYNSLTSKDYSNMYSIKFIDNGMWIKNISNNNEKNYINISQIDLDNMNAKGIKILKTGENHNKIIIADNGKITDKLFTLNNVTLVYVDSDNISKLDNYKLNLNFDRSNIIDSLSNYRYVPFYKYTEHIKNLKKFNIYSSEVSLYYLSEILKPFFLVTIGFVVMGFSGKFKRNENFFKVLFISILIGFLILLLNEIITNLTTRFNLSFLFSYLIIFLFTFIIGLYQMIRIEKD